MTRFAALAIFIALASGSAMADPHDVFGTFLTVDGDSHVTISDCGDGTPCGAVSWIDPASLAPGETPESIVSANGDAVIGLLMLKDFDKKKRDWRGGTIYDPNVDKTYASRLKRLEDGSLQLKGCIGPICQTQIWAEVIAAETVSTTSEMED